LKNKQVAGYGTKQKANETELKKRKPATFDNKFMNVQLMMMKEKGMER